MNEVKVKRIRNEENTSDKLFINDELVLTAMFNLDAADVENTLRHHGINIETITIEHVFE